MQQTRERRDGVRAEIAADHVPAERQRQAGRALSPPLAEIDDLPQSFVGVRQLPFMNQQAGGHLSAVHFLLNLIERHHDVPDVRIEQPQRQKRGRQFTGHRHARAA